MLKFDASFYYADKYESWHLKFWLEKNMKNAQ